ncbi:hypothetical protein MBLNU457_5998t1 [Dothideomycetes sp. NU457]
MFGSSFALAAGLSGLAAALPQVPGYTGADAPETITPSYSVGEIIATRFGPDSQVSAIHTAAPVIAPLRSNNETGPTSHGPYSGTPTTLGKLQNVEPIPYEPAGGLGTNGSLPRYMVNSDFDYESITLGLYQEWIELDLFHNGLATFTQQQLLDAGITLEYQELIRFMADQEQGHATLLTNMLGETAPPQCTYSYPYSTPHEWIEFMSQVTRWGESGVWGFINHLDSREVGQLLAQSIATESRQQMVFRQMSGLFPMPVFFESGIPQSWQWSFLAPYISSCPANTTRLAWQNFPALHVVNQANPSRFSPNDTANWEVVGNRTSDPALPPPANESCLFTNVTGYNCAPGISRNRSEPMSFPGKQINLYWEAPGLETGPNNSYVTAVNPLSANPQYVAWVNQLNYTTTPLIKTSNNTGYTYVPNATVYGTQDQIVNGSMFIALVNTEDVFTPFNLSMVNPFVSALGLFKAG